MTAGFIDINSNYVAERSRNGLPTDKLICPDQKFDNQDGTWRMMGFFSENRPEFILTELACISDNITIVPVPTKSAEYLSVSQIIDLTELRTLCVTKNTLPLILEMYNDGHIKHLRCIICFDSDIDEGLMEEVSELKYSEYLTFDDIVERGKSLLDSKKGAFEIKRTAPT